MHIFFDSLLLPLKQDGLPIPLVELIECDLLSRTALVHGIDSLLHIRVGYPWIQSLQERLQFFSVDGSRMVDIDFIEDVSDLRPDSLFRLYVPAAKFFLTNLKSKSWAESPSSR